MICALEKKKRRNVSIQIKLKILFSIAKKKRKIDLFPLVARIGDKIELQ